MALNLADANVSYNYRLAIRQYMRRLVAVTLVTLLGSLGALMFVTLFALQVGVSGLAVLAIASLMLVFVTLATSYSRR